MLAAIVYVDSRSIQISATVALAESARYRILRSALFAHVDKVLNGMPWPMESIL
jgi:hypothetical protein